MRVERVTVTLRSELLEDIDRIERNRSRFIAAAVEHELQRRRYKGLIESVTNPHPQTAGLTDLGTGDWVKDLADENDLLDLSTGTAVRWIEGRGWIEESR